MSATVTVSTSVILAPTQSTPGNYIVYFPNISTNGRLITVRDNDGYASTNHAVVLSTIDGAQFQTGVETTQSQIYINQPFGFITLNSQASGRYTILNTFAFPEGSAAAFVSKVTTNNLVTSTIQLIDIGTQSTNTVFTSTGNMYLNSNLMGQVTYAQLNSTVVGLGEAGYISTIIFPNITPALNIATGFTSNQYYNGTKNPDGSIVYSVENQIPPLWKNATSGYSVGFFNGGNDVVVGNPFIVAVGDSYASSNSQSYIQISVDGSNWNYALAELSSPQIRLRVSYANGLYHAIGSNGSAGGTPTIMWSRDGSTWSNSVYTTGSGHVDPFVGLNGYARGITYGNGKWVAVGNQPNLAKYSIINSTDGSNWQESVTAQLSLNEVWDVGFNGANTFLALCARTTTTSGNILKSTDGVNWLNLPTPFASSNFGIDSTNGGYIAGYGSTWLLTASNFAPSGKMLWRSADNGDTWSAIPSFNSGLLSRPYWDGALWWIGYSESNASNAPSIYYSTDDGITWSSNFAGSNSFVGGFPQGFASRNAQSNFAQALLSTTIGLSSNQSISSLRANTISTNSITAATMTVSSLFVQVEVISTSFETINTISTVISDYTSTTQLFANQTTTSSLFVTSRLGVSTMTPLETVDINGVLNLRAGTVSQDVTTVDESNRINTYIRFGEASTINDFAYLRQIGGINEIHLALDFHDDVNDGSFSIRNVHSSSQIPDKISTLFTVDGRNKRVGILTSTPQVTLDVNGKTRIVADGTTSGTQYGTTYDSLVIQTNGGEYDPTPASLLFTTASSSYPFARILGLTTTVNPQVFTGNLIFQTQNNTQLIERMRIDSNGNVGINTTTPSSNYKLDVNGDIRCTNVVTTGGTVFVTGMMMMWSTGTAPTGWLLCDGSDVSRTTYAALFDVIGTTYGSGSGTTFRVPDTRGRTGIGSGTGPGLTNRVLAATGGEEQHTLTVAEMPTHSHSITDKEHSHIVNAVPSRIFNVPGGVDADWGAQIETNINTTSSFTGITGTNDAGGSNAHNNMQPFIVINYIIKT